MRASRYRRGFTLSRELDTAKIDAQLKDGVLRLRIPKLAEAHPGVLKYACRKCVPSRAGRLRLA